MVTRPSARSRRSPATCCPEGPPLHFQSRHALRGGQRTALECSRRAGPGSRGLLLSACDAACRWADPWTVAIHVTTSPGEESELLGEIAEALERTELPPERLEIGFGEAALLGADTGAWLAMAALRDLGTGVALDDFGSGVASLTMLRSLPLSCLKLDGRFLRKVPDDPEDAAIARAAIAAGHASGLSVVARGLENEAQRAFLAEAGCDEGQGRLWGDAA